MFEKLLKLTRQLYPTGRAFRMPFGGVMDRLHRGLAKSEARVYADATGVLNAILPDNEWFTADDATDWERRLGLITNESLDQETRNAAIIRKMNHPGTIPARQNYRYLEGQLQAAGFNVFVYENRFPLGGGAYETMAPGELGGIGVAAQYGMYQYGEFQYGEDFPYKVVNSLDADADLAFDHGSLLRRTFYIGGDPIGTNATVAASREIEFRELIMKIKPTQMVGFLFVNYV